MKYIKQPTVIAEIVTGIILGKSVFGISLNSFDCKGKIPHYMDTLFPADSLKTFNVVANFGKAHEGSEF